MRKLTFDELNHVNGGIISGTTAASQISGSAFVGSSIGSLIGAISQSGTGSATGISLSGTGISIATGVAVVNTIPSVINGGSTSSGSVLGTVLPAATVAPTTGTKGTSRVQLKRR